MAGADAVLIAEILDDVRCVRTSDIHEHGMQAQIELYDRENLRVCSMRGQD